MVAPSPLSSRLSFSACCVSNHRPPSPSLGQQLCSLAPRPLSLSRAVALLQHPSAPPPPQPPPPLTLSNPPPPPAAVRLAVSLVSPLCVCLTSYSCPHVPVTSPEAALSAALPELGGGPAPAVMVAYLINQARESQPGGGGEWASASSRLVGSFTGGL